LAREWLEAYSHVTSARHLQRGALVPAPAQVVVGIVPSEHEEVGELRDWKVANGDVRNDTEIAVEMLEFMESNGVLSVVISDGIIGCPRQTGIDYDGEWCPDPACTYWHGRDRFTGELVH
jgi:hypothetical protein